MSSEKISDEEFRYLKFCLYKNLYDLKGLHQNSFKDDLDEAAIQLIEKIRDKFKNSPEIHEDLISQQGKDIISSNVILIADKGDFNKFKVSDQTHILHFLVTNKTGQDKSLDYYSILAGFNGFNHFRRVYKKGINADFIPQIDNDNLREFFRTPNYIFVYDEDKVRNRNNIRGSGIHALVLKIDGDKYFTLENIEGKQSHGQGVFEWSKDNDDFNSFDIRFKKSRSGLILRFHFPYQDYEEKQEGLNLLLGAFIFTRKKGHVGVGTIILLKNQRNLEIKPYSFDFEDQKASPKPPLVIMKYLYDRHKNWIKVPYDIFNLKQFEEWLKDKRSNNHTYKRVRKYDFVIFHPRHSLGDEKFMDFALKLQALVKNPHKHILKQDHSPEDKNELIKLSAFIKKGFISKSIIFYPEHKHPKTPISKINSAFFQVLMEAKFSIFIIPDIDSKRISSVFTTIGFSISQRKKTFVFHHVDVNLPQLIKKSEERVRLFVYEYTQLEEIPELIIRNELSEEWEELRVNLSNKTS